MPCAEGICELGRAALGLLPVRAGNVPADGHPEPTEKAGRGRFLARV